MNFISLLLIFVLIRNTIYILASFCKLANIKNKLNLTCKELNFRLYILILIHVMILWVDKNKVNENKFGFLFIIFLIYSVVTYMRILVESSSIYLFENVDLEEDSNDVE